MQSRSRGGRASNLSSVTGSTAGSSNISLWAKIVLMLLLIFLAKEFFSLLVAPAINDAVDGSHHPHEANQLMAEHHETWAPGPPHLRDHQNTAADHRILLPLVCSHRGKSDVNSSQPLSAAILDLCLNHGVCCADYDVSLTADRIPLIGHPAEAAELFKEAALEGGGHGGNKDGGNPLSVRDFTLKEIQHLDPRAHTVIELRAIVEVATALKGMGKDLLFSLEPKAPTATLMHRVIDGIYKAIDQHRDIFVVILPSGEFLPLRPQQENQYQQQQQQGESAVEEESGVAKTTSFPVVVDEGRYNLRYKYAVPLKDRILSSLLVDATKKEKHREDDGNGGDTEGPLEKALEQCVMLCPGRGPAWASYIMPSLKFVRMCSDLRPTVVELRGKEFWASKFGTCGRSAGLTTTGQSVAEGRLHYADNRKKKDSGSFVAPHMAWLISNMSELTSVAPSGYLPSYIITNYPGAIASGVRDWAALQRKKEMAAAILRSFIPQDSEQAPQWWRKRSVLALAAFSVIGVGTAVVYRFYDAQHRRPRRRHLQTLEVVRLLDTYESAAATKRRSTFSAPLSGNNGGDVDFDNIGECPRLPRSLGGADSDGDEADDRVVSATEHRIPLESAAIELTVAERVGVRREYVDRLRLLMQRTIVSQLDLVSHQLSSLEATPTKGFGVRSTLVSELNRVLELAPDILIPRNKEEMTLLRGNEVSQTLKALKKEMLMESARFVFRWIFALPLHSDQKLQLGSSSLLSSASDSSSLWKQRAVVLLLLCFHYGTSLAEVAVRQQLVYYSMQSSPTAWSQAGTFIFELSRAFIRPFSRYFSQYLQSYLEKELVEEIFLRCAAVDQWVIDVMGEKVMERLTSRAVASIGTARKDLLDLARPLSSLLLLGIKCYRGYRSGTWPLLLVAGFSMTFIRPFIDSDESRTAHSYKISNRLYDLDHHRVHDETGSSENALVGLELLLHVAAEPPGRGGERIPSSACGSVRASKIRRDAKMAANSFPSLHSLLVLEAPRRNVAQLVRALPLNCSLARRHHRLMEEYLSRGESNLRQRAQGVLSKQTKCIWPPFLPRAVDEEVKWAQSLKDDAADVLFARRLLLDGAAQRIRELKEEQTAGAELDPEERQWIYKPTLLDLELEDLFSRNILVTLRCLGLDYVHATRYASAQNVADRESLRNDILSYNLGGEGSNTIYGRLVKQMDKVVSAMLSNMLLEGLFLSEAQVERLEAAYHRSGSPAELSLSEWCFGQIAANSHFLWFSVFSPDIHYSSVSLLCDVMYRLPVTIDDIADVVQRKRRYPSTLEIKDGIRFTNVSFAYPTTPGQKALENVSFDIPMGEGGTIGIIGETGSGKSTIFKLLTRLYSPAVTNNSACANDEGTGSVGGQITVDGVPLQDWSTTLIRRSIVTVAQKPFILEGTVEQNILFGCLSDPPPTRDDVMEAADKAQLHDTIMSFPEGYDTIVAGYSLSGGEAQRLALARAFVRKPKILLLDEATSALDAHTESIIEECLNEFAKENTIIAIAHRLSTLRGAKRILVMEGGRCVQEGSPAELYEGDGREDQSKNIFRRYVDKQALLSREQQGAAASKVSGEVLVDGRSERENEPAVTTDEEGHSGEEEEESPLNDEQRALLEELQEDLEQRLAAAGNDSNGDAAAKTLLVEITKLLSAHHEGNGEENAATDTSTTASIDEEEEEEEDGEGRPTQWVDQGEFVRAETQESGGCHAGSTDSSFYEGESDSDY